jgi:hypothetical protein
MDLDDAGRQVKYLIRDRDGKSLQRNKVLPPELELIDVVRAYPSSRT